MLKPLFVTALAFAFGSSAWACDTGFEVFKKTVYAKVRRDCAECHDGRRNDVPHFATDNPERSYEQLLSYINFPNTADSLLVVRAGNGHCREDLCDVTSGLEMRDLVKQWYDGGEKSCERSGRYFTAEQAIPNVLPSRSDEFKTMTFDLEKIKSGLAGMSFQIDIQNFANAGEGTAGAYRFKSPRITGGKNAVRVQDIKLLLNGKHDPIYNAFTTIDKTFGFYPLKNTAVKTATPVLSGHSVIIIKDGLANPKLSISFMEIESQDKANPCKNAQKFNSFVPPALTSLKCMGCHKKSGKTIGEELYGTHLSADDLCRASGELLDSRYLMISPLLSFPTRGLFNHPMLNETDRSIYLDAVKNWLAE